MIILQLLYEYFLGYVNIAYTDQCPCAGMANDEKKIYGVQFHPEVTHTEYGTQILRNFIFEVCECTSDWKMDDFHQQSVEYYRETLKGKKVLLGLSGGVDSMVTAVLLHEAIGDDLYCVMIDHGLLRLNEAEQVEKLFREKFDMKLIMVDAKGRFLSHLKGVTDPEKKRKTIGEDFIRAFEEEANRLSDVEVLAQGTIYPDVIESGKGKSSTIKSHHNVGGLPKDMMFKQIVEPLRTLFKDEVRKLGLELGIPYEFVYRQPFPGPGLAVRVLGEITEEKLDLLKRADQIFREETDQLKERPDQYFAVISETRSVGVKGDARTYGYTIILRAVTTDDFMTAEWTRLPYELLERCSNRITNEITEITRVVYDITSKPPATVEWE